MKAFLDPYGHVVLCDMSGMGVLFRMGLVMALLSPFMRVLSSDFFCGGIPLLWRYQHVFEG